MIRRMQIALQLQFATGLLCESKGASSPAAGPTRAHHQGCGSAALQTTQEGRRLDVEVEKSHLTAQLAQPEPYADEVRVIAHQKRHNVPHL